MTSCERFRHWLCAPTFALVCICTSALGQKTAGDLPEVLRLVPADAHAALVVPHLKHASDDLTRLLEGMDRANLLLGLRPIDQLKSVTGYNIGVNDHGSAAIVVMDAAATPPRIAWLMPVTDAQAFLENFTGRDGEAYTRGEHTRVFAKSLGSHVVMSADQATVQTYSTEANLLTSLEASLSKSGARWAKNADVMIAVQPPMIAALKHRALAKAERTGVRLPAIAVVVSALADDVTSMLFAMELDPLAFIVRGETHFKESSAFGEHAPAQISEDAGFARLPNKPLALAMSIDLAALGGEKMLRAMSEAAGERESVPPTWLSAARSLQLAIAPSPAGIKGGLLNEATITIATSSPRDVREWLKDAVLGVTEPNQREAKWLDDQTLSDGAIADAWEIRTLNASPDAASRQAGEALLFGAAGMRGYARTLSDTVVLTCAQRPAVLAEACDSAHQATANPPGGFIAQPAMNVLRQWMPAQRDIEIYLGAGQISVMARPYAEAILTSTDLSAVPAIDGSLPPIGVALDVAPHRVDGAAIVPAGVLTPLFDHAMRLLQAIEPRPVTDWADQ